MKDITRKILVIDDNRDNLITLKALIADLFRGYITYTAASGTEGIELARKHPIDVILLDVLMPVMDGFEVCKLLKDDAQLRDIPVVFVTALKEDKNNKIRALEAGGDGFLTKPVDEQELVAQLTTMLKVKDANDFKRSEMERLEQAVNDRTRQLREELQLNLKLYQNLKESEERFRAFFEKSPVSYQSLDAAGCIVDINDAWMDAFGFQREELIGKWFGDLLAPESVNVFREHFAQLSSKGVIHTELYLITKQGNQRYIILDGRIEYALKGGFKNTHCILTDETERKWTEDLLTNLSTSFAHLQGKAFFEAICKDAVRVLGLDYVFVGQLDSEHQRISVLGGCADGQPMGELTYDLLNTPCWNVVGRQLCFYPSGVQQLFSDDALLKNMEVEGYIGVPLFGKDGQATGIMVGLNRRPLYDSEKIMKIFSFYIDRVSAELQRSKFELAMMKLSQAVEQSPASVVITSISGEIEYVNSKFTSVTGYTLEEVLGKNPRILKSGKQSPDFYRELWQTISSGKEWVGEFHNRKKNGELYWESARISPLKNAEGKIINYLAAKEDITDLMQAEMNYRHSIDQSPIGIRIVNQTGSTVYANASFLELFDNSSLAEYIATPSKVRYTAESLQEHEDRKMIRKEGRDVNEYDIAIRRKNGDIRYIKVWRKDVLWNKERHIQVINQDITREKLLYNDLVNAKNKAEESDRLKSAFLANMSHEIRTPMNGILGFAELLKEPGLSGDEQRMYIDLINKSGQRMLNIIRDIIDISKIEAGVMEVHLSEININEQFEFIQHFFLAEAKAKGLALKVQQLPASDNVTLKTDKEKLYAVLANLVKNALKFTSRGTVELGCVHRNNCLEFFVKDTGIGIASDRQQAIFERFVQADIEDKMAYQGAGLGLTISKNYVEMLGGKIWLESAEGVGSTFYFTLPLAFGARLAMPDTRIPQPSVSKEARKLKILVVEDDEVSAMLLKKTITAISSELLFATNGVEAIQKCRENSDIDLILMDIRMPVMGGYEATRKIREFNKDVVILAQTAFGLTGDREKAEEAGCNDYISKPINVAELKNKIATLLNR